MGNQSFFRKLLAFGIVANLGVIALLALDKEDVGSEAESRTKQYYHSDTLYFAVSYPKGWETKKINRKDLDVEIRFIYNQDTYLSAVDSIAADIKANLLRSQSESLDKPLLQICHETALKDLSKKYRSVRILESAPVEVGVALVKPEAIGTYFEFKVRRGLMARNMRGMLVSTWNAEKPIGLQMVCPEREFQDMEPLFNDYLKSFIPGSRS